MIRVGLVGLGGMGRTHFDCLSRNPNARIVAVCDSDPDKLSGDWTKVDLNLGAIDAQQADTSGLKRYSDYHELIADPEIDLIDVCAPTPLHAPVSIEALNAGKHVLCEKPMAFDAGQCRAMEAAQQRSGKQLMIGHCLRYWPQYIAASEIIRSEEYGHALYAKFHRSGGIPRWSSQDWMRNFDLSGGAVLDMHIHDVDAALWWFGKPSTVHSTGLCIHGLPTTVDSYWKYESGLNVLLHGSWDHNGGGFRYAFRVIMEHGTLECDSAIDGARLNVHTESGTRVIETPAHSAYQAEIDDMIDALMNGRSVTRVVPADARVAVEMAREELRQLGAHI